MSRIFISYRREDMGRQMRWEMPVYHAQRTRLECDIGEDWLKQLIEMEKAMGLMDEVPKGDNMYDAIESYDGWPVG